MAKWLRHSRKVLGLSPGLGSFCFTPQFQKHAQSANWRIEIALKLGLASNTLPPITQIRFKRRLMDGCLDEENKKKHCSLQPLSPGNRNTQNKKEPWEKANNSTDRNQSELNGHSLHWEQAIVLVKDCFHLLSRIQNQQVNLEFFFLLFF